MWLTFGDRFTQRWGNYRALIRVFGKLKNAGIAKTTARLFEAAKDGENK